MKVTKFEQSCLLLELDGTRILIDPGYLSAKREPSEWGNLDAVFFTHEHPDHFDKQIAEILSGQSNVYVNESTSKQMSGKSKVVRDGDIIEIGALSVKAVELPHCLMPDGSEGPQNTGYLVNDMFFHPGDGIELDGLSVKNLALPIIGPDVSPKDAFSFARQVSAKKAVAIHYDVFGLNPDVYVQLTKRYEQPFEIIVLESGQSTEL